MNVNNRQQLSGEVEAIFTGAIAKVKAEAQESIANIKAEFEEKIAKVRTDAEETLAKVKSEAGAKEKAYAEQIAKIRAEADAAIAKAKVEAAEMTARIKVENLQSRGRQYKTNVNSHHQPSTVVETLFVSAIAKVKAEAEKQIAKVKAEAEEKARAYTDTTAPVKAEAEKSIADIKAEFEEKIARVGIGAEETIAKLKSEAEEKEKSYSEMIAMLKTEAEEKARAYTDTTAPVKAEAEEAIAKVKAQTEAITKVKAKAAEVIAKVKAETKETIAKVKDEVEGKVSVYADTIAGVKAEVEEAIARVKAQAEEKARAYTDTIARLKAEAEEAVAVQKAKSEAEAAEVIAKIKAEAERKVSVYTDTIARVKAEVEEKARVYTDTIAKVEAEEKTANTDEAKEQLISETIKRMAQSSAVPPGEQSLTTLALCAKDIMQKEVVWGSPNDSVQQTFAKMQQYDTGYMMVGLDGVLEGIVSKSDITGAISPYLRPIFAKWRRPLDDATLQIKIKWIMRRPVRTIKPETSLETIMENMRQLGVLCLPVVDQQGTVQGLVAEVNIFKALLKLKSSPNISTSGEVRQEQSAFPHPPNYKKTQSTRTMGTSLLYSP